MRHVYILFGFLIVCTYLFSKSPTQTDMEKNRQKQEMAAVDHTNKGRIQVLLKEAQSSLNTVIKEFNLDTPEKASKALEITIQKLQEINSTLVK